MYITPRERGGVNAHPWVSIFVFQAPRGYYESMPSYAALAQTLNDALRLERSPLAICSAQSIPAGVKQFTGSVPAGCRLLEEGQKEVFATLPRAHGLFS